MKSFIKLAAVSAAAIFGLNAHAGMTAIKQAPVSEVGHEQILEHVYGGNFSKVGDDFYSGKVSAKRLDDWMSDIGVQSLKLGECGMATDCFFSGKFNIRAIAKFSGNSQSLGVVGESSGSHRLLNVSGYGFDVSDSSATLDLGSESFKWARWGDSGYQTSVNTDNLDFRDHMATYVIEGLPGQKQPTFMMFWEDLNRTTAMAKKRSWADYNDLVLEVKSVALNAVPLPAPAIAGLLMLGGMIWKKRYLARIIRA